MNENARPQYVQIAEALRRRIQGMGPNTILPSEPVLAEQFGVSRVTIRQALDGLRQSGLIYRQRGRGTIVNPPKVTRHLLPLQTIEDDFRRQNVRLQTKVLEFELNRDPPESVRAALSLRKGQKVGYAALVRSVDGRVVCDDRRFILARIAKKIDPARIPFAPPSTLIREVTKEPVTAIQWEMEIRGADYDIATVLGVVDGTQIVTNTSVEFLANGEAVELSQMSYRLDRVKFNFFVSSQSGIFRHESDA